MFQLNFWLIQQKVLLKKLKFCWSSKKICNLIVDIKLTNFFCCLNKNLVLPRKLLVDSTKSSVEKTKILLGNQKKFCCLNKILVLPTKLLVDSTKSPVEKTNILLGHQTKFVGCITTIKLGIFFNVPTKF